MLRTNRDKLVMISVQGCISSPIFSDIGKVDINGRNFVLPGTGGISYNLKIGDPACGYAVDHAEPGVSTKNYDESKNNAYNFLSCVGNEATVITGDGKGIKGFVTGMHGGIEHVICYFDPAQLDKLNIDDKINIKAFGQGMELLDYPEIMVKNLDPDLLEKMNIEEKDGKLIVPVAKKIPGRIMGSGLGATTSYRGDYDITLFDEKAVEEYGLADLRLGDIVLLEDSDNTYGRNFVTGAVSIGVVVHSDCRIAGHGPGVTTLLTCKKPLIEGKIDPKANLADIML